MLIRVCAVHEFPVPASAVFALALDDTRFPATFAGCGPVPGLRRITPHAAAAIGATRDVESSDGSVLTERITAFDPPHRHAYVLTGLRPPLAWLVRNGAADWTFAESGRDTRVTWRYEFELTGFWAWPAAWLLLNAFMRRAMRDCLAAMARTLERSA